MCGYMHNMYSEYMHMHMHMHMCMYIHIHVHVHVHVHAHVHAVRCIAVGTHIRMRAGVSRDVASRAGAMSRRRDAAPAETREAKHKAEARVEHTHRGITHLKFDKRNDSIRQFCG